MVFIQHAGVSAHGQLFDTSVETDTESVPTVIVIVFALVIAVFIVIVIIECLCSIRRPCSHSRDISYAAVEEEVDTANSAAADYGATRNINPPQYHTLYTPSGAAGVVRVYGSVVVHDQQYGPPSSQSGTTRSGESDVPESDSNEPSTSCGASNIITIEKDEDSLPPKPTNHKYGTDTAASSKDAINKTEEPTKSDILQAISNSMEKS